MANENDGFFINVEGKTGGPFPRDAIIKEIERGRFKGVHFVWDGQSNRWLKASEHPLFAQYFGSPAKSGAAATGSKYYLSKQGARFGPFGRGEVEAKIAAGEFGGDDYIWDPPQKKWVKLATSQEFAAALAKAEEGEPEVPPPLPETGRAVPERSPSPSFIGAGTPPLQTMAPEELLITPASPPAPPPRPAPVLSRPGPPVAPPAAPTARGPSVGEIVNLSFPQEIAGSVATDSAPATTASPKATAEERVKPSLTDDVVPKPVTDIKVDRSVVLDFVKPSNVKRLSAQVVDFALMGLVYFAVALVFSSLNMNPYLPGPDQYYFQQLFWTTFGVINGLYFLLRDSGGASIGKRIMGLRVVKLNDFNRQANMVHSLLRNVTLLIPFLNLLEIVYVLTDVKGRRLGDRAAGTVLTETTDIDYIRQHQGLLDEIY